MPPSNSIPACPRVLFVAFQTERSANGGIQSLSEILLRLKKVSPVVLTQRESAATQAWREAGLEVHVWKELGAPLSRNRGRGVRAVGRLLESMRSNKRVARFVRKYGISVVHCNDGRAALSVAIGARLAGARVVLNIRDTVLGDVSKWRLLVGLSNHVIVLSREMAEQVAGRLVAGSAERWLRRVPLSVSYSVVDPNHYRPGFPGEQQALRGQLGIPQSAFAVVVVGALMAKKQQLELLKYLSREPSALPSRAHIFFVGDCTPDSDPYSAECCRVAADAGALSERIHLVGYTAAVRDWYQAADLTLIASRHEGLARAMIESLACGTPVVSFDCCSAREILEGQASGGKECGRVVSLGDFRGLWARIRELSEGPEDAARLAKQGRRVAAQLFEPERVVNGVEKIYLELASK